MPKRCVLFLTLILAFVAGCSESPRRPDDDDNDPGPSVDPVGFHLVSAGDTVLTWMEGDPLEDDTLELTWQQGIGVTFVWLDGAGAAVDPGDDTQLIVTTPDARFATFSGGGSSSSGVFNSGGFPEVETSFRVRFLVENHLVINTPDLLLHVSPPPAGAR